ncbi:MAG: sigma-70 family RNA polymerase sigma factor [Candidatus Omnitrophica bacterium]|nr:sigma-70 family RNA polymerase sigma factor [Candidatus Omnitrophota bacterium]
MDIVQPDELLVQKARQGNRDAFGVLVRRYQGQAILVAQNVLRNLELAKDASQNAFAKAYFGLGKFREDAKFKTWLFRIVINEAKDVYRKERSRGLFRFWSANESDEDDRESILEIIPSTGQSPREAFEAQEAKKRFEQAIDQLPDREREVFILRYLNDFSLSEIAEALGIALGTVKAHLSHGTEKLKSTLLVPAELKSQAKNTQGGD